MPIIITPVATAVATVSLGLGPTYTSLTVAVPQPKQVTLELPPLLSAPSMMLGPHLEKSPKIFSHSPQAVSSDLRTLSHYITQKCLTEYPRETARQKGQYYAPIVYKVASTHKIPPTLLASLIWHESHFNPREISSTGALGLGQILPLWFRHFHTPISQWSNPTSNLHLTCKVLKTYHTQTSRTYPRISSTNTWHRTLVAYNMGFSKVSRGTYRSRYSTFILKDSRY